MRPLWGVRAACALVVMSVAASLASAATPTPPAASAAAPAAVAAEPDPVHIDGMDSLPLPGGVVHRESARATPGWNPLYRGARLKVRPTYRLRLVRTDLGDAGRLRSLFERLVLTIPNTDITVAPGTGGPVKPRKGEITVVIANHAKACEGVPWIGCGPPKVSWVRGTNYTRGWVHSARIYLKPRIFDNDYGTSAYSVLAHELGHNLGLGHIDTTYEGRHQVMYTGAPLPEGYQSGDRNGLRSARKVEAGWRNFRIGAVDAVRFNGKRWLFGTDAQDRPWVRRPARRGFRWQRLDGALRGTPGVVVANSRIHVFGVGTNGDIYYRSFAKGKFSGWRRIAVADWIGGLTAIVDNAGRPRVFGRTGARSAAQLYSDGTSWHGQDLGGTFLGDITGVWLPSAKAYSLWGIGTNGRVYQRNWFASSGWDASWSPVAVGGGGWRGSVEYDRDTNGRYHLWGLSAEGRVRHASWRSGDGWSFWQQKNGPVRGRIGALRVPGSNAYELFAPGLDGRMRVAKGTKPFRVL